jgi:hypothetical protein
MYEIHNNVIVSKDSNDTLAEGDVEDEDDDDDDDDDVVSLETHNNQKISKPTKARKAVSSVAACKLKPRSGKKSGKISAKFAGLWP